MILVPISRETSSSNSLLLIDAKSHERLGQYPLNWDKT